MSLAFTAHESASGHTPRGGVLVRIGARLRALRCEVCRQQYIMRSGSDVAKFVAEHRPHLVTAIALVDLDEPAPLTGNLVEVKWRIPREEVPGA